MSEPTKLNTIIDPKSGDTVRAEDIASELCAVLRKYGYALLFNPTRGTMALAQVSQFGHDARVIAEIARLTPDGAVWRKMDWTPKDIKKPS